MESVPPSRPHAVFVAALALLAAAPGLLMGLHADDWFQLAPRTLPQALATFAGDWSEGARGAGGFYRPLVRLSFWIDETLWRGSWTLTALGCHLTQALLFVLFAVGTFRAGEEFSRAAGAGPAIPAAIAAAAILSPVKNEALYWASGRTDLLAAACIAWSLRWCLRALAADSARAAAASLALFGCGLASKEVAIAAGAILPLAAVLLGRGRSPARLLLAAAPPAIALLYLLLRRAVLGGLGGYDTGELRTLQGLAAPFLRMWGALWWPWQSDGPAAYSAAAGAIAAAACAAWIAIRGLERGVLFGLGAMAAALAPMILVDVSPGDGGRVLLLALAMQAVLLCAAAARLGPAGRRALAVAALGATATLQPDNVRITAQFLRANEPNAALLRAAYAEAGRGGLLVLPEPPPGPRRILDPGAAALMALRTMALREGIPVADGSDPEAGLFAFRIGNALVTDALQPFASPEARVLEHAPAPAFALLRNDRTETLALPSTIARALPDPARISAVARAPKPGGRLLLAATLPDGTRQEFAAGFSAVGTFAIARINTPPLVAARVEVRAEGSEAATAIAAFFIEEASP